jgi:hypothetical protein
MHDLSTICSHDVICCNSPREAPGQRCISAWPRSFALAAPCFFFRTNSAHIRTILVLGSMVISMTSPRQRHDQRRFRSAITSKIRQRRHATANVDSVAPLPTWLGSDNAPWPVSPRQHHCQHWLGSAVASMTRGLDAYFPDQPFDSEVPHRWDPRAPVVLLRLTARLGHALTYSADLDSRRARRHHNNMGHFVKPAKSFSCILFWVNILIYFQLVNIQF